jgi:hypothetical protein
MRLYVPLNRQEYEALERLAFAERRRPRDQAAMLLAQVLESEPRQPTGDRTVPSDNPLRPTLKETARASA